MLTNMHGMRHRLVQLVGGWLVFQFALLAVPPAVLWSALPYEVATTACTCSHADGASCPMHHPPSKSTDPCSCRSASETGVAAMMALLGPQAVLADLLGAAVPVALAESARPRGSFPSDWIAVPDGPPPRS